jgi:hypothetical protein
MLEQLRAARDKLCFSDAVIFVDFPLDVFRYCQLLDAAKGDKYSSLDEIAIGMREMLGRLH